MGLVSAILTLPLAPVRMVIRLAELIQEQADRELHDPAAVRRRLEAIQEARESGQITEEEERLAVQQVLQMATRRTSR
jgi:gas vesicle protein GvpG